MEQHTLKSKLVRSLMVDGSRNHACLTFEDACQAARADFAAVCGEWSLCFSSEVAGGAEAWHRCFPWLQTLQVPRLRLLQGLRLRMGVGAVPPCGAAAVCFQHC